MTDKTIETESAVIAKLRAANKKLSGEDGFVLASSGVRVTYPKFRAFAAWENAQRVAEGSPTSVNLYYIIQVCRFDGERLRVEDYRELISDTDHMAISNRIFGGKAGEATEGND
ncbi:hypothetical protein [Bosea sp. (in: a-proteobacteria)]|jgi:hypothetical protein|uniref:hypothetical protein n=1 Tax=Bosea sp. (in: a-proteobacteria) TaxID=1871050 RepID=UPI00356715F0